MISTFELTTFGVINPCTKRCLVLIEGVQQISLIS